MMKFEQKSLSSAMTAAMASLGTEVASTYLSHYAQQSPMEGVFVPAIKFCVHPTAEPVGPFSMVYDDPRWSIVLPEVAKERAILGMKLYMLMPVMVEDQSGYRKYVLAPIPLPTNRQEAETAASLMEVFERARTHWVKRRYDKDEKKYAVEKVFEEVSPYTMWPDWFPSLWIEACFKKQIITADHPLAQNLRDQEIEEEPV